MAWNEQSNAGDVYLTPIMQYLGGHGRRGNDPHELGEYEVADMRTELEYLTDLVHMDATFLVASLIRAVKAEPIVTPENYGKTLLDRPVDCRDPATFDCHLPGFGLFVMPDGIRAGMETWIDRSEH
ncbi:MAG: hypothetical protein PVSMB7_25220 [Chloroflexota bacterium]